MLNSILTKEEIEKFKRQAIVGGFDSHSQKKLFNSKVLIVGVGGLGCPVSLYLAASGIGNIDLIEDDSIELHNLPRQILFTENDINKSKVETAKARLREINPKLNIKTYETKLSEDNVQIMKDYDVIVDCSDSIHAKYLINDYSRIYNKNIVIGSVLGWQGQIFSITTDSSCYRCLFPAVKEFVVTCDMAGVVSPMCGIIGTMQAIEVIKFCINDYSPKMIVFNGKESDYMKINLKTPYKNCLACNKSKIEAVKKKCSLNIENENVETITWKQYIENEDKYELIDVRPAGLYNLYSFRNSKNVPYSEFEDYAHFEIDENLNYAILCNKGITAAKFAEKLGCRNKNVFVIKGGLSKVGEISDEFPKI